MTTGREDRRGTAWARRLAGTILVAAGPVLFAYVLGHRGYFDILAMRRAAAETMGEAFWGSAATWLELADGALFPSIWLFAASGTGLLLLVRANRGAMRRFGIGLVLWGGAVAALAFPPFLGRPDFDPAPWSPFVIACCVGVLPGAALAVWGRRRAQGSG